MAGPYPTKCVGSIRLDSHLARTRTLIDSELAHNLANYSHLALFEQVKYAVLSPGKRLRSILVILSSEAVQGTMEQTMPLAIAFEFIHTATLIHDDLIDEGETRRGLRTVYDVWGRDIAVLTGDALIAMGINLAANYGRRILEITSQAALDLCDGQFMDISRSHLAETEDNYFVRIRKKSAALFKAAAWCGALCAGATEEEAERLSSFGEDFGIAYQIVDDCMDFLDENYNPLREGFTLPLIYMKGDETIRGIEAWEVLRRKRAVSTPKVFVEQTRSEALAKCERKIGYYINKALLDIRGLRYSEYKTYLGDLAESLWTMMPKMSFQGNV